MKKRNFFSSLFRDINLPLLIFLVLFLNVKFVFKLLAIVFMILYSRNLKLGLSRKNSRLPQFYLVIILVELFKYILVTRNYTFDYTLVCCLGLLQWSISLLALHYIKLFIEKDDSGKVHNTIKAFFALNFLVSMFFLLLLIIHPAWLSFWGQGTGLTFSHPSAGDAILGISFDASTVNAAINCLGLIYFLHKREILFSFLCAIILVCCTSNIIFLLTLFVLVAMILTVKSRLLRLRTAMMTLSLLVLYIPYSPMNRTYMRDYLVQLYVINKHKQPLDTATYHLRSEDSTMLVADTAKLPEDSIYSFSDKKLEKAFGNLISFKNIRQDPVTGYIVIPDALYQTKPGKLASFIQTFFYLKHSFKHLLLGSGIGNFSSKLAFRASGEKILGTYPQKYVYISPDFKHNHLFTFRYYYEASASKHSVINYPFSFYNQILGEYGLVGAILFAIFYLGYFISRYRKLSYGRYLLLALLGFLFFDYWFESFTLVIMFELLILLNIKEGRETESSIPTQPAEELVKSTA
jgi:hypothetical protein